MSKEDYRFAKRYMEWGDETLDYHILEFDEDDDQMEEFKFPEKKALNDVDYGNSRVKASILSCVSCGDEVSSELAEVLHVLPTKALPTKDDENETMLKQLQKAQNEGLSIEYRCPRCRTCNDCRRSFETERVSLREEAEDLMIWDSVKIDW